MLEAGEDSIHCTRVGRMSVKISDLRAGSFALLHGGRDAEIHRHPGSHILLWRSVVYLSAAPNQIALYRLTAAVQEECGRTAAETGSVTSP